MLLDLVTALAVLPGGSGVGLAFWAVLITGGAALHRNRKATR